MAHIDAPRWPVSLHPSPAADGADDSVRHSRAGVRGECASRARLIAPSTPADPRPTTTGTSPRPAAALAALPTRSRPVRRDGGRRGARRTGTRCCRRQATPETGRLYLLADDTPKDWAMSKGGETGRGSKLPVGNVEEVEGQGGRLNVKDETEEDADGAGGKLPSVTVRRTPRCRRLRGPDCGFQGVLQPRFAKSSGPRRGFVTTVVTRGGARLTIPLALIGQAPARPT